MHVHGEGCPFSTWIGGFYANGAIVGGGREGGATAADINNNDAKRDGTVVGEGPKGGVAKGKIGSNGGEMDYRGKI
ncbi:hypothetical protein GOP47_0025441 [Adiantum capillus-veneris]|uniref:Uncharacterized protein n=1 Tax=Adiantum capillus-veneris TaxID=13818 RepID=A0A9D4Z3K4_ADICA|nr:hypothetical protein GOP47_0025441 [Adiantum capillus-veneris]